MRVLTVLAHVYFYRVPVCDAATRQSYLERAYAEMMRSTIALNGSFFNTQRMVSQYLTNAYSPNAPK